MVSYVWYKVNVYGCVTVWCIMFDIWYVMLVIWFMVYGVPRHT